MRRLFISIFCFLSLSASGQFKNIKLAEESGSDYPPVEPSITISQKDPNNIVAGIVLNRVVSTSDGGATWSTSTLESPYGVHGDPALISDVKGHLYYFHLSNPNDKESDSEDYLDRIVCQISKDGGQTWSEGESIGNNPPKDQDKPWPAVHPRKEIIYTTWTQFDKYGLEDPACQSNICSACLPMPERSGASRYR
jgi:hypothetical protein